jgi:hypothetical protein
MIGVSPRTMRRKLVGKSRITESDALAIKKAGETAADPVRVGGGGWRSGASRDFATQ